MSAILRFLWYPALFRAVDPDFSSSSYKRLVNSSIIDARILIIDAKDPIFRL